MVQGGLLQRWRRERRLLDVSHAEQLRPRATCCLPRDDNANYRAWNGTTWTYTDAVNSLTPVGSFAASPGPFGTFDQGGDLARNGTRDVGSFGRAIWGGEWSGSIDMLYSEGRGSGADPTYSYNGCGFRVASVPWGWHDPGDANGDGQVDVNNLTIVLTNFDQTGMTWSQGEFTGSRTVDINDLTIVLANFGTTYASAAGLAAVPEPSALLLIALGVAGLVACTRRRRR